MESLVMAAAGTGKRRPLPRSEFWRDKKVVLTGHSGFKGGWLALWLARMGATVTGIGLAPETKPNLFTEASIVGAVENHFCDIRDAEKTASIIRAANADVIFHMAAQPLVRESYRSPVATFATNVMGTVHVLDALRGHDSTRVAVMITTDKVYANREWPYPYREDDVLGGHDPYSASKAACEIAIASYRQAFLDAQGVAVASTRAGNVIGGGDWSKDRLLPDAVRAWQQGSVLLVRRPDAVRPWQHVLEPLSAYLVLAERLWDDRSLTGGYNIGPGGAEMASVRSVIALARTAHGGGDVEFASDLQGPHEARSLALETAKARVALGIEPFWDLRQAVERTVLWYRELSCGAKASDLCHRDIAAFEAMA